MTLPIQPDDDAPAPPVRPLSPFETVFWRLAEAGSLNVTTVATVRGPLREDALRAGLHWLQQRHPLLQVRIGHDKGPACYEITDVPSLPLRIVTPNGENDDAVIEEEINDPIDAERGPLARCTWVRHDDATHRLLITFHHVIGDGMSGVYLLRDLVQAAGMAANAGQEFGGALHDSVPMDLRLPSQASGTGGLWRQIRFVARVTWDDLRWRPPARPRAEQDATLSQRRTVLFCRTCDAATVDRLARKAREQQTTVHGALSAAICLATVNDTAPGRALSVKHRSPVNMRTELVPPVGEDVGMFASMAFFRGRIRADDEFWPLARAIRHSIKGQIDRGVPAVLIGMLPRLYRLLDGDRLTPAEFGKRWQQRTASTTGLTNLGRLQFSGDFGPLQLDAVHFAVSPGGLGDCACTATTFAGCLRWNFVYASPLFSHERARQITEDAIDRLRRAIAD